jgi:putative oxidoreductase
MGTNPIKMKTNRLDYTLLFVRILLAAVVAAHGSQKLFGWFGGFGFEGTMGFFTQTVGLPYVLALGIVLAETLGMIALALGAFSRFFSLSIIGIMLGAIVTTHGQFGFFMNWFGAQGGEGFEFHLLVIGLSAVIGVHGGGALSVDALLSKRNTAKNTSFA